MKTLYSGSTLKINLSALANNYSILKEKANGKEVAAVVKANAYGLGVEQIAPVFEKSGCKLFFVANLDEAIQLRKILSYIKIVVFNGIKEGELEMFKAHNIIPVINCMYQIKMLAEVSDNKLESMLHVDSGMNRLGMSFKEYKSLVNDGIFEKLNIKMILSHLACADDKSSNMNAEQLSVVENIKEITPNVPISFANSYGVFLSDEYHFDVVRPGIALYGGNPCLGQRNPMQNVVEITSNILQIRNIDSVQTVGYGATYELKKGTKIATLPVGYADGYFRIFGNKAHCAINGKRVPVVGRVSMDLITIDITSIKDGIKVGDEVEILGSTIKLSELADIAGTIDYEILTSLGSRYKRVYTN